MDWPKTVGTSEAIETKERSHLKDYRVTYGRNKKSVGRKTNRTFFSCDCSPTALPSRLCPVGLNTRAQTIDTIQKGACGSGQSALAGVPFERYRTSVTVSALA